MESGYLAGYHVVQVCPDLKLLTHKYPEVCRFYTGNGSTVSCMLVEICRAKNRKRDLKQHTKYFNFWSKIQLVHPVHVRHVPFTFSVSVINSIYTSKKGNSHSFFL